MAKKVKIDSLIGSELGKFEDKLKEFQDYLSLNNLVTKVTNGNEILLSEDSQDQLHKEIVIQIKMQEAILGWLPIVRKLKEEKIEEQGTYGDAEIGGMFKK